MSGSLTARVGVRTASATTSHATLTARAGAGALAAALLIAPLFSPVPAFATGNNLPADTGFIVGDDFTAGAARKSDAVYVQSLFDATNKARRKNKLKSLDWSPELAKASLQWSLTMSRTGRLQHTTQNVRENVWTCSGCTDPTGAVKSWLKSSGHYRNIMNTQSKRMGIGVAQNSQGKWYVTQRFDR